jgi:hypothetical protein
MYCLRQTYSNEKVLRTKIGPLHEWLEANIGPGVRVGEWYSYGETSKFMPLSDALRSHYKFPRGIELNEIMEIEGTGWMCYNTFEYVLVDGDYLDNHHGLYVILPDETIAIQCKLAAL